MTRNAGGGLIANAFVYDVVGRKMQQSDPDTGLTRFEYNALGELTAQIDALAGMASGSCPARPSQASMRTGLQRESPG